MVPSRYPIVLFLAVLLSALLIFPSIQSPFVLDDYIFLKHLKEHPDLTENLDLYSLIGTSDIADQQNPWWTHSELKLRFFRPLSSLLLYTDYHLVGLSPLLYHLHSLAWLAALIVAYGLLYQRLLPGVVGVLALVLAAVDDSHGFGAFWIANRNALVATVPIFYALWAHIRWQEEGWAPGLPLSIAGYCLGLLGGEMAVSALAYVAAYSLIGHTGTLSQRIRSLAPILAILSIYTVVYRTFGYGTHGSDLYTDPMAHFPSYLASLPTRLPALLADVFFGIPSDAWNLSSSARLVQLIAGVIAPVCVLLFLRNSWNALSNHERKTLIWIALGTLLSLFPAASTLPSSRQLLCASFGGSAIIAILIRQSWRVLLHWKLSPWLKTCSWTAMGLLLVVAHVVIAPSMLLLHQSYWNGIEETARRSVLSLPDQETLAQKDVIVLGAPFYLFGRFVHVLLNYYDKPLPHSWKDLMMCSKAYTLTRLNDYTLILQALPHRLLDEQMERCFRARHLSFKTGDSVDLGTFRACIDEADALGVLQIRLNFSRPLDDESLLFLTWNNGTFKETSLPDNGNSITIQSQVW